VQCKQLQRLLYDDGVIDAPAVGRTGRHYLTRRLTEFLSYGGWKLVRQGRQQAKGKKTMRCEIGLPPFRMADGSCCGSCSWRSWEPGYSLSR
jgi:hypothetical protein